MMASYGILPIRLARAHGIEEVAEVREDRLGSLVLENAAPLLGPLSRPYLRGDHLGVLVIGVIQRQSCSRSAILSS